MEPRCLFCGGDASEPGHLAQCDGRQDALEPRYPEGASWKNTDTSREAAASVDAATIRDEVFSWLRAHGPHTADEAAAALGRSILTVRPRVSELRAVASVYDTGWRRPNPSSGKQAIVWAAVEGTSPC